ncbi:hypothetical protein ACHAWF_004889 [Thalassiosira exigua]
MSGGKKNNEVEKEVFNRFSRIVKEKFTAIADGAGGQAKMNKLDVVYAQPEFNAEKGKLNDMNQLGLPQGVMCGIATFAFLRWSPGAISRMLQRRAGAGVGASEGIASPFAKAPGYKFDAPPGQPIIERPSLFFRSVRLTLDLFVSFSLGAYASLYFVDKNKMMKTFTDLPLVEGRSLLSEELCEDFAREFRKFDREIWDKNHQSLSGGGETIEDGEHDFRNTMQGFVANCKRRAIYEGEIRKERGLGDSEPVVVPSPGVPRDISVSLDDLLGNGEFGGNDDSGEGDGEHFYDTYFDSDDDNQDSFTK